MHKAKKSIRVSIGQKALARFKMADNDSLEYYITFPNSNFDRKIWERDGIFLNFLDGEQTPVVVLFGWAGAIDKHLSVYSKMYEERGLITLRYITPSKTLLYNQSRMPRIGEKLVQLLFDLNFENHPIIVHCFSNGGAFTYQVFSEALKNSSRPLPVKGVIFDSAPGKKRFLSIFRAIKTIRGENGVLNWIISFYMAAFVSFLGLINRFLNLFLNRRLIQMNPFGDLIDEDHPWPQHFIYSKTDILIPFQDVEVFASYRKTKGTDVSLKCYQDTPHVRHYPYNKTSYVQSVFGFINKCLNATKKI